MRGVTLDCQVLVRDTATGNGYQRQSISLGCLDNTSNSEARAFLSFARTRAHYVCVHTEDKLSGDFDSVGAVLSRFPLGALASCLGLVGRHIAKLNLTAWSTVACWRRVNPLPAGGALASCLG